MLRCEEFEGALRWDEAPKAAPLGDILRIHDWAYVRRIQARLLAVALCAAAPAAPCLAAAAALRAAMLPAHCNRQEGRAPPRRIVGGKRSAALRYSAGGLQPAVRGGQGRPGLQRLPARAAALCMLWYRTLHAVAHAPAPPSSRHAQASCCTQSAVWMCGAAGPLRAHPRRPLRGGPLGHFCTAFQVFCVGVVSCYPRGLRAAPPTMRGAAGAGGGTAAPTPK